MADEENGGDYFTTTEHESWGGRMKNSLSGLCLGPLLMLGSVVLLFWNEGRNVHRIKDLQETERLVSSLSDASYIDNGNDGKLIHISGQVQADAYLYDEVFGVTEDAIKLLRVVETYQWVESSEKRTKKNAGGSKTITTTYSYDKEWERGLVDSYQFQYPDDHENPEALMFEEQELSADNVMLGAFLLSDSIVGTMNWYQQVTDLSLDSIPEGSDAENAVLVNSYFYFGNDQSSPSVGDTRVSFYDVPTGKISIIAMQSDGTVAPYYTSRGGKVLLVEQGVVSAQEMIEHAEMENRMLTWMLRAVGVALSYVGFTMLFEPLTTFADVIPLCGNILEHGVIPCLGFIVAIVSSVTVIAIAWLFYRPLIGISLLVVVGAICCFVYQRAKKKKQEQQAANGPIQYNHYYDPEKPQQASATAYPQAPQSYSSQNDPAPFSQALDQPAPQYYQTQQQYPPPTAPHAVQPTVVQATVVEPEVAVNPEPKPFVTQIYKPFG